MPAPRGEVYLVGSGPGGPGLITVRGLELVRSADIIIYDQLIGADLLKEAREDAELINVGKKGGYHKVKQDQINKMVVQKAREGKLVVRLKGGDPFLFGRGGEEAEELRNARIDVHVVPGVTSAISVPALAGIPITHRDFASFVTFITGHESEEKDEEIIDWHNLAKLGGTLVILMGMANLGNNMRRLMDGGLNPSTPVAVIHRGSTPEQKVVVGQAFDIEKKCIDQKVGPPAVIVVGNVAKMRELLGDLS